ncbi:MAG: HD domain-containing protein [Lentisphaeria bacterium]|nr:HD domain-containing protein [Lentisphaeria bacterium]
MTSSDRLFVRVREAVERKLSGASGCHDFDHTLRVLANARMLATLLPEADRTVVELAALLHDIARPEELESQGKICHAVRGAEIARAMLTEFGASETTAAAVASAVRSHRYRDEVAPQSLEAKIVFDADKLDSLGAVGLGRAFLFAGRVGARLHNTEDEALNSPAYSREDTAYREYLVKLRRLPAAMLTPPGRTEGARRLRFMRRFFERLEAEIRAAAE